MSLSPSGHPHVTINWHKGKNIVDNDHLMSHSPVDLRSYGHTAVLESYAIYEQVPKILQKLRGDKEVFRRDWPAKALPPAQGRYRTANSWELPSPQKSGGKRRFVAKAGDGISAEITSADIFIAPKKRRDEKGTDLGGTAKAHGFGLKLPSLFHWKRETIFDYIVSAPKDPLVEVRVLQGDQVRDYLTELATEWTGGEADGTGLPGELEVYWSQELVHPATLRCAIDTETPLTISVEVDASFDVRAALCLRVCDVDANNMTTSDPLFVTGVGDRIVISDLPPSLLSEEALGLLRSLAAVAGSVQALASAFQRDEAELADEVETVIGEVGTDSLTDALALIAAPM